MYGMRPSGHLAHPLWRRFAVLAAGSVAVLFFGLIALTSFHFVPLFPLLWVLPFLAVRAMWAASARAVHLPSGGRDSDDGKETELLVALERRGQITATRVALETSLGVGEADERLSRLAEKGHLRVRPTGGASRTPCGTRIGVRPEVLRPAGVRSGTTRRERADGFSTRRRGW